MSAMTFEIPVGSIPGLQLRDGMPFRGFFKEGKMQVTVDTSAAENETPPAITNREKAAREYVEAVRGALTMPTQEDRDADPRFAYLYKKHVLCIPSDELF